MKASRVAILLWVALIVVLLGVELTEITHFFTLPVQNAIADPLAFVVALIFTTLLALVGAIFIGVFLSHRLLSTTGFTPFEEEMLRMRADLREVKRDVAELRGRTEPPPTSDSDADEEDS
ncbi:MAG TPA: hypothetical protein VGG32_08135 [Thermoplasmata archaeon]